jgi:hypothetical protein
VISAREENDALENAYVPEHTVSMMKLISGGEPFLTDGYLSFAAGNWAIVVGYPLHGSFRSGHFSLLIEDTIERLRPDALWFIAPEPVSSLARLCHERESDDYYTLTLEGFEVKGELRSAVARASRRLQVSNEKAITTAHQELISEFLDREGPAPRLRQLLLSMPDYVAHSDTAGVLTARDQDGNVCGFFVVELAAANFATYVVGCRSGRHRVAGASDLLFFEMVNLARAHGKRYIHLGLGVNEGIRRFKRKWGGVPSRRYEFFGHGRAGPPFFEALASKL